MCDFRCSQQNRNPQEAEGQEEEEEEECHDVSMIYGAAFATTRC